MVDATKSISRGALCAGSVHGGWCTDGVRADATTRYLVLHTPHGKSIAHVEGAAVTLVRVATEVAFESEVVVADR